MTKDEMKNRISLALKDPTLQQGFEIICKNLTEQEEQIADIKANCDLAIEGRDIKIMELEKENAELKEWQKDTIKARGNDYMDWSRMKDQLTKAKELLERLVTVCNIVPLGTNYDVVKKAEQFLKEIEK